MIAFLLFVPSIISAICFGLSNGFSKKIAQVHPSIGLLLRGVTILAMFAPLYVCVLFFASNLLPQSVTLSGIALTLLLGVVGYLPIYFFYHGVAHGYVAVMAPIANTRSGISLILTALCVGIQVSLIGWVGILLLVLSAVLISLPDRIGTFEAHALRHSVVFGSIASVLWGVVFFLFQFTLPLVGPFFAAVLIELGVLLAASVHIVLHKIPIDPIAIKHIGRGYIVFIGVTSACASFLFAVGVETVGFAYATAIGSLAPLVASLVGIIALKEPWNIRHIVAIMIGCLGLIAIAFS